jgi:hypothetical protein
VVDCSILALGINPNTGQAMNRFHTQEIERVVSEAQNGPIPEELSGIIYSLGRDAENDEEYDYAFHLLTTLSRHHSVSIVSMVIVAYSLLALYHKRLDRAVVEPIIKKAWSSAKGSDKARIRDAVDDINYSLKWKLDIED